MESDKVSVALSVARRDLAAKMSGVDNVRRDWATERSAFLDAALREHDCISTEGNTSSSRLIFLVSDAGNLELEVADTESGRDAATETKADEARDVSEVASLSCFDSALLLDKSQAVQDELV